MVNTAIISADAFFWDGTVQLSGVLELRKSELIFHFDDFKHSHLNLNIKLSEIKSARSFSIFNIVNKGLRIDSYCNKVDYFVLDNCKFFHSAIVKEIKSQAF